MLSGAHMTLFARVIELLKEQNAADIAELSRMGVAKIFTPGAPTTAIVAWVNETLGPRRAA